MLNISVLGAGRIGQIHARNIANNPQARLSGIFDVDAGAADRLATALGSKVVTLDAAFQADAILIGTPTPTHADFIERAALAGKAVFCEKPVDLSVERVKKCLVTVQKAGVPLMVGFNRRFDPSFSTLQHRLAAGEVGKVELVTILSRDPNPPPATYVAASGGIFRDMMIHDLDMARFLLGDDPVVEVYAMGSAVVDPAIGAAGDVDTATVSLRAASGALVQISNSRRATYGYDQRIEVHCAGGLLRAGNATATTVESATAAGFTTDPALPFFLERYAAAYRAELNTFIESVNAKKAPAPGGLDGLKALVLADAATVSCKTGKPVTVDLNKLI